MNLEKGKRREGKEVGWREFRGGEEGGKGREGGEGKAAVKGEMVGGWLRNDQMPFKTYKH